MSIIRPKFFYPVTISASNRGIVINAGAGDVTVNIAQATYTSAESLRAAVETAIQTVIAAAKVYLSVEYRPAAYVMDRSGRFIFYGNGTAFTLKAGAAGFTAYEVLGFFAITYTSSTQSFAGQRNAGGLELYASATDVVIAPMQHQGGWYPTAPAEFDSLPIRDREMNVVTRAVSGQTKTVTEAELEERRWRFTFLESYKVYRTYESTTRLYESFERLWDTGFEKFRFFPDELSESGYIDYVLTLEATRRYEPRRQVLKRGLYEVEVAAWKYVT